jgi:hypothetical protein
MTITLNGTTGETTPATTFMGLIVVQTQIAVLQAQIDIMP